MYAILNEIPANNCVAIIVSSDEVDSQKISIPHIVEYFDDIDKKIFGRSMTSEQASRYAQFITELDESVCHIYCCFQSAQSRSAAVASALYKYYGDDKTAYSIWEDPMYSPNPYVFMLLCEALGVEFDALIEANRQAIRKAIQHTRNQTQLYLLVYLNFIFGTDQLFFRVSN